MLTIKGPILNNYQTSREFRLFYTFPRWSTKHAKKIVNSDFSTFLVHYGAAPSHSVPEKWKSRNSRMFLHVLCFNMEMCRKVGIHERVTVFGNLNVIHRVRKCARKSTFRWRSAHYAAPVGDVILGQHCEGKNGIRRSTDRLALCSLRTERLGWGAMGGACTYIYIYIYIYSLK